MPELPSISAAKVIFALPFVLLLGCRAPAGDPEAGAAATPPTPPPAAAEVSDGGPAMVAATARFLAGLEAPDAPQPASRLLAAWETHAAAMDKAWDQVRSQHLEPIGRWVAAHPQLGESTAPLFYPFGGPDLLGAMAFFPRASSYLLVGLERPGVIPRLDQMRPEGLEGELERLRGVLDQVVLAGYFVRSRMRDDLPGEQFSGMVSVFYILLARLGATPTASRYLELTDDGNFRDTRASDPSAVRIDFRTATGEARAVYYLSQDLSDQGIVGAPGLEAFLEGWRPHYSFMKSAQYLPHMEGFREIGRLVLAAGGSALQDDSGLPASSFQQAGWKLTPFGVYRDTLPVYREYFQPELASLFAEAAAPLPFSIGYNSQIGGTTLILADPP